MRSVYANKNLDLWTAAALLVSLLATMPALSAQKDLPRVTHDGLELVPDSKVAAAWAKPGVDFSGYKRILILEAEWAQLLRQSLDEIHAGGTE